MKICDKYPNNSRPKLTAEINTELQNTEKPSLSELCHVKEVQKEELYAAVSNGVEQIVTVKPEKDVTPVTPERTYQNLQPVPQKSVHQEHLYVQQAPTKSEKESETENETEDIQFDHVSIIHQEDNMQIQDNNIQIHQFQPNDLQNLHTTYNIQQQLKQDDDFGKVETIQVHIQEQQDNSFQNPASDDNLLPMHQNVQIHQDNLQEILVYPEGLKIPTQDPEEQQDLEIQMIQVPNHAESVEIHTEPIQGGASHEIHFPAGYQAIEGLLGQQVVIMTPEQAARLPGQAVLSTAATHRQQHEAVPTSVHTQHVVYQQQQQQQQQQPQ